MMYEADFFGVCPLTSIGRRYFQHWEGQGDKYYRRVLWIWVRKPGSSISWLPQLFIPMNLSKVLNFCRPQFLHLQYRADNASRAPRNVAMFRWGHACGSMLQRLYTSTRFFLMSASQWAMVGKVNKRLPWVAFTFVPEGISWKAFDWYTAFVLLLGWSY